MRYALLLTALSFGCAGAGPASPTPHHLCRQSGSGCASNADCCAGLFCASPGVCQPDGSTTGAASTSTSGSGGQGGSTGASVGGTSTGSGTTGGGASTSGGSTGTGWTSGASATGGGSISTGSTGSSTGGSGGSCSCSASCCSAQSTASSSAQNGLSCGSKVCWGGYWCDYAKGSCPPTDPCNGQSGSWSCSGSSGGSTGGGSTSSGTSSGGTGATLQVGGLDFVVVGDTRPASSCTSTSSCAYPSQVINSIYTQVKALSPAPSFAIGTGDYMFQSPSYSTADWQIQQYLSAQQLFGGPLYPAMGNHECTGATTSNCVAGQDGTTSNLTAFLGMLGTLGIPNAVPYFVQNIAISTGQTAKLVVIAANAWDSTQASWLTNALAQPTTYTFIVRHEPSTDIGTGITGLDASAQLISTFLQQTPGGVTFTFVGHTHEYRLDSQNQEVIVGNGGAPFDNSSGSGLQEYGFLVCQQRTDNAIQCQLDDYQSGAPVSGTAFAVNPDGSTAQVQ
ncbi:MAG: hypothetical protein ACYCWW_07620 [Deltaproteobacteria bacterium]